MQLRPYQQKLKTQAQELLYNNRQNVVAVMATGAGKSLLSGSVIADHPGSSCIIAHRQELVSQMAMAAARCGVRHRIIGNTSLVKFIVQEQLRELGTTFFDPNARCAVAGVDTLIRRKSEVESWARGVTLWVQDECFPAGTMVSGRPIESLQVGDMVDAFDEATGQFHKRRVMRLFKNPIPDQMVRIVTRDHHVLNCTSGHPIWTRDGWKVASEITIFDEVLQHEMLPLLNTNPLNQRGAEVSSEEDGKDILHDQVRDELSNPARQEGASETSPGSEVHRLHASRESERASDEQLQQDGQSVLLDSMHELASSSSVQRDNDQNQQPEIGSNQSKDEGRQSDEGARDSREGQRRTDCDESSADTAWWKWTITYFPGREDEFTISQSRFYPGRCDKNINAEGVRIPDLLQARPDQLEVENCDRGGWCEPSRSATFGQEKGRPSHWHGVESVEIYKSAGRHADGDGFVYNIEVDEFHTYVANGVVVHNCHHLLRDNKWGEAAAMFPNAVGFGVTATPVRADGKGLGRHAEGLFDTLIEGPSMRWLIEQGFLTDYDIACPSSDIDLANVPVSASTGDYSQPKLKKAVRESHIVGDVVSHYLKLSCGKLAVVFATDLETSADFARSFVERGVRAEVISGNTPDHLRAELLRRFKNRELDVLVNVDLFGEGVDIPALETVIFARPTQSYGLYCQMFGRALRPMAGKSRALIIDHVGNVCRHGLPDAKRAWSLDSRDKRRKSGPNDDEIPLRPCPQCTRPYLRALPQCPYCEYAPEPAGRSAPEFVDGDLLMLDPETLARMRGEVERIDDSAENVAAAMMRAGAPGVVINSFMKQHKLRQEAQAALRQSISWWAGHQKAQGRGDSEAYRRFYLTFDIDILSAQSLGRPEAMELADRINQYLGTTA